MNQLKRYRNTMIVFFVIVIGWASYFTWYDGGTKNAPASVVVKSQPAPQELNLAGKWHSVNTRQGMSFTAEITSDSIQIDSTLGDSSGIFWLGSFDQDAGVVGSVKSLGDQDAMKDQIFASEETYKVFNYTNGQITFDYSIMGVHSTITLVRS